MVNLKPLPNEVEAHRRRTGRPFVTLSYAQSLDGCIAAEPGRPLTLSGPESLKMTHQLRAAHDAILVGIGTVLADNPRLNVRLVEGVDPQPVIVDSRLRFPLDAALLQKTPAPWIVATTHANPQRQQVLEAAGARILSLPPSPDGRVELTTLLDQLSTMGIGTLMVEGGAGIITSFLAEQLVNRIILTIAPVMVGGMHGVSKLPMPVSLHNLYYEQLGQDMVITGQPIWEVPCND